ncbi:MBL fold metallo-hydrolase [Metabacillus fastidiosus]|uniref:MBL fold metallo-hydrolase n=1 Tax=Metabacillus fastidiosus TaxID=1458 RepID=UPI003D2DF144
MKKIPLTSVTSGLGIEVLPDLYCLSVQIANVCFIGDPRQTNEFILIDAGMPNSADLIIKEAKNRFGEDCKLISIILTHGHFDHVGALQELLEKWNVPVYTHSLEEPYLTGKENYPPPNKDIPGLVAKMSPLFPRHSIDVSSNLHILPPSGKLPSLPGWEYIHTPGHTPGHISLFRENDRVLIAGDAFTNVEQESLYEVLTQKQELHGPPAYFTTDWDTAWNSIKTLAILKPNVAICGHGLPIASSDLAAGLHLLARDFDKTEIPSEN